MKKKVQKLLSILLALMFLVQIVQMSVYAQDNTGKEDVKETTTNELAACSVSETPNIVCEIEDKRTEYSKTFKMDDGSYNEITSALPLHTLQNDTWIDVYTIDYNESFTIEQVTESIDRESKETSTQISKDDIKKNPPDRSGSNNTTTSQSVIRAFTYDFDDELYYCSNSYVVENELSYVFIKPTSLSYGLTRFVVNAGVYVNCSVSGLTDEDANYVAALKAIDNWNETTTSYDCDNLDDKIYDSHNITSSGYYLWDITELYHLWERNEVPCYGIVLSALDESPSVTIAGTNLYFIINYREINPLDNSFPSYSFDMGRAGTIAVNEFTNEIVVERYDLGIDGETMPVSIKGLYYNDNFGSSVQYGYNWSFNYNSQLIKNGNSFTWTNPNGNRIYFERDLSFPETNGYTKWLENEDNYTLMVNENYTNSSTPDYSHNYIESVDSYTYEFDSGNGFCANLVRITDCDNKIITISYQNGNIAYIQDGVNRKYIFSYACVPGSNISCLSSIVTCDSNDSPILINTVNNQNIQIAVNYSYTISNYSGVPLLNTVTFQDNQSITYIYDDEDRISSIINIDGTTLDIDIVNNNGISKTKYTKYKNVKTNVLDSLEIDDTYTYLRIIKNKFNEFVQYTFNRSLQVQSYKKYLVDGDNKQQVIEQECYKYEDNGSINSVFSKGEDSINTLLVNPSFESNNNFNSGYWIKSASGGVSRVNKESASSVYFPVDGGSKDLKILADHTSMVYASQEIDVSSESDFPDGVSVGVCGWAKIGADNISAPSHFIGIKVYACYNNISSLVEICSLPFDSNIVCEWQYNLACFRLNRLYENNTIASIVVQCECDYQDDNCEVRFDELKMYITDDYYEIQEPTYCSCTNCSYGVGCPCECASEAVCNCPECNGITPQGCVCGVDCHFGEGCQCECVSASVCNCVSCKSYTYVETDSTNHTVRTITTDGIKDMVYEKSFTADDNYVIEEVDENGIEVSYNYANPQNGLITSSQDSYGTTNYAYDAMGRLAEIKTAVSGLSNGATHIKNEYSYQNDRISSITHNGFTYNFLYNDYGDYYAVLVGNSTLITYGYNDKQQVNCITYENGDSLTYTYLGDNIEKVMDPSKDPQNPNSDNTIIYRYYYDIDDNLCKIVDNISNLTTELNVTKLIDYAEYFVNRKTEEMYQANAAYIAETGDTTPENLPYGTDAFNNVLPDELDCEEIVYRTDNPRDIRYARVVEEDGVYEYFAEEEFYKFNTETTYNPVNGISINSTKTKHYYYGVSLTSAYSQDVFGRMVNTEDMYGLVGADIYTDRSAAKMVVEKDNRELPKSIDKINYYYDDETTTVKPQITGLSGNVSSIHSLYYEDSLNKYHDIDTYWEEYTDYLFEYDNSNRLIRVYHQNGNDIDLDVRYTYNNINQIVREDNYSSYYSHSYTLSYDENGKITKYSGYVYTLGVLGEPDFEWLIIYSETNGCYYRTDNYKQSYNYEYSYDFDNNGNIIAVYDGLNETTRELIARYSYDNAGQLIREDNAINDISYTYTYDAGGNIVQKSEFEYSLGVLSNATKTISYSYDNTWKDKLTNYNGKQLVYDKIGNPEMYGTENNSGIEYREYEWNGKQLISCMIFNCDNTPGLRYKYEYKYDYEGNVCQIKKYNSKIVNDVYVLDEDHPNIREYKWKDGNLLYECLNPKPVSTVQPSNYHPYSGESSSDLTIKYLYDENEELYGCITNGSELFYYQKNLQGDITGIIRSGSTDCMVTYNYDAFGNMSYELHYFGATELIGALLLLGNQSLTYRGYMYDINNGMYYLHSRFYVPEWGRFLNADSFFDTGEGVLGTNVYTYCYNNPVNRIDPYGEYSYLKAKNYAQKWWDDYNPQYKKNSNDCANFVSQCLYEGKLSRMTGLLSSGWHHWRIQVPVYSSSPISGPYISGYSYVWQISNAWGQASELKKWLDKSKYVSEVITITKVSDIKDKIKSLSTNHCMAVIFFKEKSLKYYSHVAISGIVDKKNGNIYYYAHTSSRNGNDKSEVGIREVLSDPSYERIQIYVLKS